MSQEDRLLDGMASWIQREGESLAARLGLCTTRNQAIPSQVTVCHLQGYLEMCFVTVPEG